MADKRMRLRLNEKFSSKWELTTGDGCSVTGVAAIDVIARPGDMPIVRVDLINVEIVGEEDRNNGR